MISLNEPIKLNEWEQYSQMKPMQQLLGDEMHFSYEHCLECGTCYVACDRKVIEWEYPCGD